MAIDVFIVALAEEEPDGRGLGHHIRLIAAVHDDVVDPVGGLKVFPFELDRLGHEHHRVQRRAPPPGRAGGVGGLTGEAVPART